MSSSDQRNHTGASPARMLALKATRAVREREAYATNIMESMVSKAAVSEPDRAFASLLTLGVVATSGTLDSIIDGNLDSPRDVKPRLRDALRIPVFEMVFLHKEAYVSVSQGVALVSADMPRAARLANVVLRRVARDIEGFPWGDPGSDMKALARLHGYPFWMAERIIADRGWDYCNTMFQSSDEAAPLFVATNLFCTDDPEALGALHDIDPAARPFGVPGCVLVADEAAVVRSGIFDRSIVIASDAASQVVATLATPDDPRGRLLEVGSGRGTKSILIENDAARRSKETQGTLKTVSICALDIHGFKQKVITDRLHQLGIDGVTPTTGDATLIGTPQGPFFDIVEGRGKPFTAAFIDAPCSGLGTLRRHPEERWRMTEAAITELAHTGLSMLQATSRVLASGAKLVYSTCTPLREEDEDVINRFLASPEGKEFDIAPIVADDLPAEFSGCATDEGFFLSTPTPGGVDGHFAAKLIRRAGSVSDAEDGATTSREGHGA